MVRPASPPLRRTRTTWLPAARVTLPAGVVDASGVTPTWVQAWVTAPAWSRAADTVAAANPAKSVSAVT